MTGRYHEERLRVRLLCRYLSESSGNTPGISMSSRRAATTTRAATASSETATPAKASTCHHPSERSKAQKERQADRASNARTTNRSIGHVTNPHQPRTLISTASVPAPAQASENPAAAGMSTDRPHGPGGLVVYHMLVILRASMTICDGGRWRSELGCGGAIWLLGPDPR